VNSIKTISLKQPWASLVAMGIKRIETRSWAAVYRGPLAIHASASTDKEIVSFLQHDPFFQSALKAALGEGAAAFDMRALPRGAVLGIGFLEDVIRIPRAKTTYQSNAAKSENFRRGITLPPPMPELAFGDYEPGRFAWVIGRVKTFEKPAPAKGSLSLWEWDYSTSEEAVETVRGFYV